MYNLINEDETNDRILIGKDCKNNSCLRFL